jgi:CHAT domain-containing protein
VPLVRTAGDGAPVVVCPTGPLHALPWSGLPSCDGRAVSVVPSLRAIEAPATPLAGGDVVLAAGPGLDGVGAELEALAAVYPDARTFGPASSSVDTVLAALEGAEIAHLACHGSFRVDNPMFSSLELADGPLTVFDLEKLRQAPRLVVLAACDVGTAAVSAGDELLGLGAALHRAGTESVVASLVPVPDDAAVSMMVALHREVAAGEPVAVALARARQAIVPDRPAAVAVRSAFACFGLG